MAKITNKCMHTYICMCTYTYIIYKMNMYVCIYNRYTNTGWSNKGQNHINDSFRSLFAHIGQYIKRYCWFSYALILEKKKTFSCHQNMKVPFFEKLLMPKSLVLYGIVQVIIFKNGVTVRWQCSELTVTILSELFSKEVTVV